PSTFHFILDQRYGTGIHVPLQQVGSLIHRLSISSHESYSPFRNDPSLPAEQDKIRLRFQTWVSVLAERIDTDELVQAQIEKILSFFINVAYSNDLSTTSPVQSLQDALSVLRRRGDFSREI